MNGSRGATAAVDVGVSHLNMNINVIGHGLGSTGVGVQGGSETTLGDSASGSPSPPVAFSTSNGGLPSGRSRSPGFEVAQVKASESSNAASSSTASVFLAGATVVAGTPATSSLSTSAGQGGGSGIGRGNGWGASAFSHAEDSRNDVDHAFAGAMLQRSTSAPPMSDHVDGWSRRGAPQAPEGGASGPAADSDYYYFYYAPHSINPRIVDSSREVGGSGGGTSGSRMLAAPIAQARNHVAEKSSRDGARNGDDVIGGRTSPIEESNSAVPGGDSGSNHFRKLNGLSPSGGDDSSGVSRVDTSPATGAGGVVGNGAGVPRSASPPGFVEISRASASGAVDSAFDIHGGTGGVRYGAGSSTQQHRDDYIGRRGGGAGGGDDFVNAIGSLSLGSGGGVSSGSASLQYGASGRGGGDLYVGGHAGRAGMLHGIMPPSPYNGPQMSPYNGAQVPQAALMAGIPPLTPEMHSTGMGYQLEPRHLAQLSPPDPRFDARMQGDRGGIMGVGREPASHLRGGNSNDGYYQNHQGGGGQQGYGVDPRYPRVLHSPRGPIAYPETIPVQPLASPMLGSRRSGPELVASGGTGGGYYSGAGVGSAGNGGASAGSGDPRMVPGSRMRGRGGAGGRNLGQSSMMFPRAAGAGDPFYGAGGRGVYGAGTADTGGSRFGGGGRGVGMGMGIGGGAEDVDLRGGRVMDGRGGAGDIMRGDVRVDGRGGDVRDGGSDMGVYHSEVGGGAGGGGGRRAGAIGMGGERMMRGLGHHPRDVEGGGMHGGIDIRMDLAGGGVGVGAGHERMRGDMGGMRDQRSMGLRGGPDHRALMRRADMRHGMARDGPMGGRGGGYMDPRGVRDRERGISGGGRPGGGLVGVGGGGVGPGGGRGSLLDEFRSSIGKNRKWELADLHGHTVQFCRDQHGSRFIQQKLEVSSDEDKETFFEEILPHTQSLMTDVFGNYVVQKLFDNGSPKQREALASFLVGHAVQLSLQMYGCRVVQKALEYASIDTLIALVSEFSGQVMKCVQDQNGNHVVQKCIEVVSTTAKSERQYLHSHIQFIIDGFLGQVEKLSMHAYGCRVIQRILEHCIDEQKQVILEEIKDSFSVLIQDQYGNYVIQHVLKHGRTTDRGRLMLEVKDNLLAYSQHKFASNVVEKCLQYGTKEERGVLIQHLLYGHSEGTSLLQVMVCDPYANYVVQKIIDVADQDQRQTIIMEIRAHAAQLKRYTFGKHIISRLEKLSGKKM